MKIFTKLIVLILFATATFASAGWFKKSPEKIEKERQEQCQKAVSKAQTLLFDEKNQEAIKLLEDTYTKLGEMPQLCESLAFAYSQDGQYPMAAIYFEKASALTKNNPDMLMSAAKCYEQADMDSAALGVYERYLKLRPNDDVAWRSMARLLLEGGKYQEALNAYLTCLKHSNRNPNTTEAAEIGTLFLKLGNKVQAKNWLEPALKATDESNMEVRTKILVALVDLYLSEGDTPNLEATVELLNKIDANILATKYPDLMAQLKLHREKVEEAKRAIEEKKKAEADAKAKEEADLKAKEEAELKAKEETELKAKEAAERKAKEEELAKEQNAERANQDSTPALKDIEETPEVNPLETEYARCRQLIREGKISEAEKLAHKFVAADSEDSSAWILLSRAYNANGKHIDAYLCAKEALKRDTENLNLTLFTLKMGSYLESNEIFLNNLYLAYEKFPYCSEIMLGLARTYALMKNERQSKYFYDAFLDNATREHPLYRKVQEELEDLLAGRVANINVHDIAEGLPTSIQDE